MNYDEARKSIIGKGTVPRGYFGEREQVHFALMGRRIITVAACGCFSTGLPDVLDKREALHMLRTHPTARNIRLTAQHNGG